MNQELRAKAEEAKQLYRIGKMTREDAQQIIVPYLEAVNNKSKELAKKYDQKPKLVTFAAYLRSR